MSDLKSLYKVNIREPILGIPWQCASKYQHYIIFRINTYSVQLFTHSDIAHCILSGILHKLDVSHCEIFFAFAAGPGLDLFGVAVGTGGEAG